MALKIIRALRPFVPTWEGNDKLPEVEQIRCKYRTLTVGDMFAAQNAADIDISLLAAGEEGQIQDRATREKNWDFLAYIVATYSDEWENVSADGQMLTTGKQVVDTVGLGAVSLINEVGAKVLSESMGLEVEVKNSTGQSALESLGSGGTAESALPDSSTSPATAKVGT